MNQELKHRLIGAAVITALAAIFIPMLFDDPIDDTGQLVSELAIPAPPGQSDGAGANKAPASIDQVLEKPAAESDQTTDEQKNLSKSGGTESKTGHNDGTTMEDAEQTENDSVKQSQSADLEAGAENYVEEEMELDRDASENALSKPDQKPGSLDTGIVEEANQTVKSGKVAEGYQRQTLSKQISPNKPLTAGGTTPEKMTLKDAPGNLPKSSANQVASVKPSALLTAEEAKKKVNRAKDIAKKSNQELVRWYLQAGSFGRKDNALTLFETLRKQGLPVLLETVQGEKGTLYRLKVGPELSRKRAIDIKAKLENQKIKTMLIAE